MRLMLFHAVVTAAAVQVMILSSLHHFPQAPMAVTQSSLVILATTSLILFATMATTGKMIFATETLFALICSLDSLSSTTAVELASSATAQLWLHQRSSSNLMYNISLDMFTKFLIVFC